MFPRNTVPFVSFVRKVREVLVFVSRKNKITLLKFALIQALTGILDLIGIALIGVIGSIALRGVAASEALNPRIVQVLEIMRIESYSLSYQVSILAILASLCLIARSVAAYLISSRVFHFLGREGAVLSTTLVNKILKKDIAGIESHPKQESLFIVTAGSNKVALDVAGSLVLLVADVLSLGLLIITLMIVDVITATISVLLFGGLALLLFNNLKNKAERLGGVSFKLHVEINSSIISTLENIRFIKTANLVDDRVDEFSRLRQKHFKALAELSVMPYISKYVFEIALIISAITISGIQFVLHDSFRAITTLTIFLAAGGRLAPAALRIQQSLLMIKANLNYTLPVIGLYKESEFQINTEGLNLPQLNSFHANVELTQVDFSYPNTGFKALDSINLVIPNLSFVAIVGPSGSGKSTLMDVLLGLNTPQNGSVTISSRDPLSVYEKWPGKVAYVPQATVLMDGTIAQNIAFGRNPLDEDQIMKTIQQANLAEFVSDLEFGIHTQVGELGSRLSAGQRQRIGIARALFSEPELLVMDEPTSALDALTEQNLADSLMTLRHQMTLVVIAHRLSTITSADKIVYISNGKIVAEGTMSEVRSKVPEFELQSKLLGITDRE